MTTSIILPTYNERENLGAVLDALRKLGLQDWEAIVVDDHSPDGTGDLAESLARQYPLRVVHRIRKEGLASAIVDGCQAAQGSQLVVMDADLSHDPRIIPELLARLQEGAMIAIGSRYVPGGGTVGWPFWRQGMSQLATLVARGLFRLSVRDPMSGFFALQRDFFQRVQSTLRPRGYKILLELLVRGKPTAVREVGFLFRDRQYGKSKITLGVIAAYGRMLTDLLFR